MENITKIKINGELFNLQSEPGEPGAPGAPGEPGTTSWAGITDKPGTKTLILTYDDDTTETLEVYVK